MIKHILKLIWNKKGSNALMALEILLSFIVLFFVLAFVFFNFERTSLPLGFETKDRWIINLDNVEHMDSLEAVQAITNLRQDLLAQDEIEAVTFTSFMAPFRNSQWSTQNDENGFTFETMIVRADADFAKVLGSEILEGRWFTEEDGNRKDDAIILNKRFVDSYYPGQSRVDSTLLLDGPNTIVGVIGDYRYTGEFQEARNIVFAYRPYVKNQSFVVLKMKPNVPASFEEKLSSIVNTATKTSGSTISTLEKDRKEDSSESWILVIALLFICGFLCLNVALGLFGVLWYNISKRKSEIGLRQAVGANGFDITKQFIIEILVLTFAALAIGIFFAIQIPILEVTEYPNELFYKAIIYACLIILTLVFSCALFPSIQAAKITPANSLHED